MILCTIYSLGDYIYDNTSPPTLAFQKTFSGMDSTFVRNITHTRTHAPTHSVARKSIYPHAKHTYFTLASRCSVRGRTIDIPSSSSSGGEPVEAGGKRTAQRKSSWRRRGVLGRGRRPVAAAAQVGI